jgi:hypothetical protein
MYRHVVHRFDHSSVHNQILTPIDSQGLCCPDRGDKQA